MKAGRPAIPGWMLAAAIAAMLVVGWIERDLVAAFVQALGRILIAPEAGA